jgi:hypothetical protein
VTDTWHRTSAAGECPEWRHYNDGHIGLRPSSQPGLGVVFTATEWAALGEHFAAAERACILAGVIEIVSKFEYDLAFTAPELYPIRIQRLKDRLADLLRGDLDRCCDLHGRNCEPPCELCCHDCTESDHPRHERTGPCSNPDLSGTGAQHRVIYDETAVDATNDERLDVWGREMAEDGPVGRTAKNGDLDQDTP